jgi:dolichol-phosphate mannosyltransferase
MAVRHCFHVLPGETILELGAGSGLWTEHLVEVTREQSPILGAVFNPDLLAEAQKRDLRSARFVHVRDLLGQFEPVSYNYVVGTAILGHNLYAENLNIICKLLKPGGQLLFFEANYWNPQVWVKNHLRGMRGLLGEASCQTGIRKIELMQVASHVGLTDIDIVAYDIIHPRTPRKWIASLQAKAFVFEQAPLLKELCGTLYINAKKPAPDGWSRPLMNLAEHACLTRSVSFVVPSHNEEANVELLASRIIALYGDYVHEIIFVNDNSTDRTAQILAGMARRDPRIKVINRKPPPGVGRALKEGFAFASGNYILTMDCDFLHILPEFRDLFDVVAGGRDGAIGSRFSHDSILLNYPFLKILCNRGFHLLVKLLLVPGVRDISNNLKLYRADILKNLTLEEPHFAANVETGLKPLLAGCDLAEVPISWINRTAEMGTSSFSLAKLVPDYTRILLKFLYWRARSGVRWRRHLSRRDIRTQPAGLNPGKTVPRRGRPDRV